MFSSSIPRAAFVYQVPYSRESTCPAMSIPILSQEQGCTGEDSCQLIGKTVLNIVSSMITGPEMLIFWMLNSTGRVSYGKEGTVNQGSYYRLCLYRTSFLYCLFPGACLDLFQSCSSCFHHFWIGGQPELYGYCLLLLDMLGPL